MNIFGDSIGGVFCDSFEGFTLGFNWWSFLGDFVLNLLMDLCED